MSDCISPGDGAPAGAPRAAGATRPLLAIDTGSPRVSVAVGGAGRVRAEACERRERSSATLLALIDRVLGTAGVEPAALGGVIALRGPGSFTGLRVGLATALGLHQALGLPAVGIPTLEILACAGPGEGGLVVAAVEALRGEWFAQPFRSGSPPRALAAPRILPAEELPSCIPGELAPGGDDPDAILICGFGVGAIGGLAAPGIQAVEPPPLAGLAVRHAGGDSRSWDPATLVSPLYLRPPSARRSR